MHIQMTKALGTTPTDGQPITRQWATSDVRRVSRDRRNVYVKRYLPQPDLGCTPEVIRRRLEREIDLFQRMQAHPSLYPHLGIPKLIEADAERGVVVTEEVAGRAVQNLVLGSWGQRSGRECMRALYLAGKWLRWFQSLPVRPGDEVRFTEGEPIDLVEYCDVRLERVRKWGYGWPDQRTRERIKQAIAALVERAPAQQKRLVWCHADYAPGNIMWDGAVLTPIDFGMSHLDYPLADVTYFVHRLEMLPIYFPWRRWPIAGWRRAILRGYRWAQGEDSAMYRAMMIRHLHCRLATYVRRPRVGMRQRLHNPWVLYCVRRKLLRMVSSA